jgi:hypothetical protein
MTTSSRIGVDAGSHQRFSAPVGISIVAVVATAVMAVAFILLSGPGSGPGTAGSLEPTQTAEVTPQVTPTSTLEPTPTPTPVPTAAPISRWSGLTWSDPVTPPFVVHLRDLVPWDGGYVAVGEVDVAATRSYAAFLASPDGLNWTITEQHDPGIDRYPRHVLALHDELLAFSHRATTEGSSIGAPSGTAYDGPHIWSSTDGGSTWSLVESPSWKQAWNDARVGLPPEGWDELQHDFTTGLVDVASGPDGLVAVGNSFADDRLVPVLLHSTDGRSWSEVGPPADSPSALLNAVVTFGDGFVLVGAVDAGPRIDTATPAAWFSTDGITWTRATVNVDAATFPDGAVGSGEMGGVTAGGGGLIGWFGQRAIAVGGPRFSAMWTSADGVTWDQRDLPQVPSDGGAALDYRFVGGDGKRIVALGPGLSLASDPQQWRGLSEGWASTDGVDWTALNMSRVLDDWLERMWVVPDGVIYAGLESFWFGTPTVAP